MVLLIVASAHYSSASFVAVSQQKKNAQPEVLTLNKRVEGVISENDSPTYTLSLTAGQYLRLEIVATRLDVIIQNPSGQIVLERACDNRQSTPVSIIAKTSGEHLLVLRAPEGSRIVQHFTLRMAELRQPSHDDLNRIQAGQFFTDATRLRRRWQTESTNTALKLFQQAQNLWTSIHDPEGESLALVSLGRTYEALDQTARAIACYERALTLSESLTDDRRQIETLTRLASLYASIGENTKTLDYGNRALEMARLAQDKHLEAETLNNIGDAYYGLGDITKALPFYKQSFEIWNALGDAAGKAQVDISFGYAYLNLSETEKARSSYFDALMLSSQAGDRQLQAITQRALGNFYTKVGQPQRALDSFRQALHLIEQGEGQLLKARVLAGIAHAYERLGDFEKALAYDRDALRIFESLDVKWGEAETQMDLGRFYYSKNDIQHALESYNRALSLADELKLRRFKAQIMSSMGQLYASRGDHAQARNYYTQSLGLTGEVQDQRYRAYTLNFMGELDLSTGKHDDALKNFKEALRLNRLASDPVGEVTTLYNLARLSRDSGDLVEATKYSENALQLIESIRATVAGGKLRASFGGSVHQHYELRIDILMQQHQREPSNRIEVAALEVSERGRARSWLESLAEAKAKIREGVDQSLLDRADALQRKLDAKAQDRIRMMSRSHTSKEEEAMVQELGKLASDYEEIQGEIRANSQRYAELPEPVVLSGEQVQKLLDDQTLMLEFSLGDDRSYAWIVSSDQVRSVELPGRKSIESTCRRLYDALGARSRTTDPTQLAQDDALVERLTKELGSTLLAPMHDLLGQKRLLVVADGALQYVPFEVLVKPGTDQPLIADHEIVYLPSASVMAEQRARSNNRPVASKTLAIFADPVFEQTDSRVNKTSRKAPGSNRTYQATTPSSAGALRDAGFGNGIPRLSFSYSEAQRIISLVPNGQAYAALGFDANRSHVTNGDLGKYRFLHFATHGLLNSEHPELSGIVLSMVDGRGNSQNGFLQLHEIYDMHLPVELVVLSACQTALGEDVRGEGLFGLTRGFMYAGARRTVSSLWKVDDSATAELMASFYKEMLVNGKTPSAALRTAKNSLSLEKRRQQPFYWAGFILQGEWLSTN